VSLSKLFTDFFSTILNEVQYKVKYELEQCEKMK